MTAEVALAELRTAGDLHELLDRFAGNAGERAIPHDAVVEVVMTTTGGDRMDPVRHVPRALRFTWEI